MTTGPRARITGVPDFYCDIEDGTLLAVSFLRPYEPHSGHLANSATAGYEYFLSSISNTIIRHRDLFAETAIFVTFDEGGGYYDSGYIQPLVFSVTAREFR